MRLRGPLPRAPPGGPALSAARPARSGASLALRSLLAATWFGLCFFVGLPALVLGLSGSDFRIVRGAPALAGLALLVAAHAVLLRHVTLFVRRGRGTPAPLDPPRELVVEGLYRRVRNPMYWVYVAVVLGEALLFTSWALALYALGLFALAHFYVVRFEEPALERRFGAVYLAYKRRVPRWWPGP